MKTFDALWTLRRGPGQTKFHHLGRLRPHPHRLSQPAAHEKEDDDRWSARHGMFHINEKERRGGAWRFALQKYYYAVRAVRATTAVMLTFLRGHN